MSTQRTGYRRTSKWLLVIALTCMVGDARVAFAQPPGNGPDRPAPRDPTLPSAEIQRRSRASRPSNATVAPRIQRPVVSTVRTRSLDSNEIVLQSLVQSSGNAFTATLRSGDRTVTVSFERGQSERLVELPGSQFAEFASTVQRLSGELRQLRAQAIADAEANRAADRSVQDPGDTPPPPSVIPSDQQIAAAAANAEAEMLEVERQFLRQALRPQQIDLASSFSLGGNLYRVIDFTSNSVLLEQLPIGRYVIVR
ncbi:MAG: hypothetical protein AAFU85_08020 [Planctomycetota bacterium]